MSGPSLFQRKEKKGGSDRQEEKREWLGGLQGVTLGSDGYIPFRNTIDCASRYGVHYVVQPGGSLRDEEVIHACNGYGMVMAFTQARLFHH